MSTADSIKPVLNANLPTETNGQVSCCKYHRTICLKAMRSIAMLFDVVISTALIFGTEPWFAFIVSIVKHHEKNFSYNSFVFLFSYL
jgi:hypothetical protein